MPRTLTGTDIPVGLEGALVKLAELKEEQRTLTGLIEDVQTLAMSMMKQINVSRVVIPGGPVCVLVDQDRLTLVDADGTMKWAQENGKVDALCMISLKKLNQKLREEPGTYAVLLTDRLVDAKASGYIRITKGAKDGRDSDS